MIDPLVILRSQSPVPTLTVIYDHPPFLNRKVDDCQTGYNKFVQSISLNLANEAWVLITKLTDAKAQEGRIIV